MPTTRSTSNRSICNSCLPTSASIVVDVQLFVRLYGSGPRLDRQMFSLNQNRSHRCLDEQRRRQPHAGTTARQLVGGVPSDGLSWPGPLLIGRGVRDGWSGVCVFVMAVSAEHAPEALQSWRKAIKISRRVTSTSDHLYAGEMFDLDSGDNNGTPCVTQGLWRDVLARLLECGSASLFLCVVKSNLESIQPI